MSSFALPPITPTSVTSPNSGPTIGPIPGFNAPANFPTNLDAAIPGGPSLGDPLTGISNQLNSFNLGTLQQATGSSAGPTATTSTPSTASSIAGAALNAITGGSSSSGGLLGLSLGRVGAFLLGLVFIAGGIYLFGRPSITQAAGRAIRTAAVV